MLVGVVALSLVVGGIVIMNIMLMVVSERTREIGLRKALGARRADIMAQMLTESVVLSMFGGVIGTILGAIDRDHDFGGSRRCRRRSRCGRSRSASASPRWSACSSGCIRRRGRRAGSDRGAEARVTSTDARRGTQTRDAGHRTRFAAARTSSVFGLVSRSDVWPVFALPVSDMAIRASLVKEVVVMAFDTVRGNKMRSALTVLGVVIGITSIVGMTAMIRGFDQSLREMIRAIGPEHDFRPAVRRHQLRQRRRVQRADQAAEPDDLRRARARGAGRHHPVRRHRARRRRPADPAPRVLPRPEDQERWSCSARRENFAEGTGSRSSAGRFFNGTEVQYRKNVCVLGNTPYQLLFGRAASTRSARLVRIGSERFEVVGVFDKRPAAGGFNLGPGRFRRHPVHGVSARSSACAPVRISAAARRFMPIQIALRAARRASAQDDAIADVERVMRIRHGLRLDEPDDFDILTQDAFLKLWDQISQGTFFALIVISSIALMVGGIGVMAIMSISVTERTREIGVRKALGARRAEILFQFLMEAAFLTSLGGLIGIALGAGIGWAVHLVSGFPISLPWWSFAIGIGFSASVGIFFGMYPAFKASRLDPDRSAALRIDAGRSVTLTPESCTL